MQFIPTTQVAPHLGALFTAANEMPVGLRCHAILNGDAAGCILTDDPVRPTCVFVQEMADGTVYMGGSLTAAVVGRAFTILRQEHEVIIGMWPDDPRLELLPTDPDYEGVAIDFTDRIFGSAEKALENGLGYCLIQDHTIVCEAFAGPCADGVIEIGIGTHEAHRGRGYATVVSAHLIHACEERGYQTFWNTAQQNKASVALARKLGYRTERPFRVWAWGKQG